MNLIHLHTPLATNADLRRLHLFPGRHLGEVELDQAQHYADARLAHVLAGARAGILHGLEVQETELGTEGPGIVVQPGAALGADGRTLGLAMALRETWAALLDAYRQDSGTTDLSGFYYLVLRRGTKDLDYSVDVDACRRTVADPYRDTRLVAIGTVALQRLAVDDTLLTMVPQRAANLICAAQFGASVFDESTGEVPLGLLAVRDASGAAIAWFNMPAGRYLAAANAAQRVLAAQVDAASAEVARAALTADDGAGFAAHFADHIALSYLPGAGALPLQLLRNPAGLATDPPQEHPALAWPPVSGGVDMVPIASSQVGAVLARELARGPVHLGAPAAGDRLRLLLVVADRDYRVDLLDRPAPEAAIESDVYDYGRIAYQAWLNWAERFRRLYHLSGTEALSADAIDALGLPDEIRAPQLPDGYFKGLIQTEMDLRGIDYTQTDANGNTTPKPIPFRAQVAETPLPEELPLPYRDGAPDHPGDYQSWLVNGSPPTPATPTTNGLLIQYAVMQVDIEAQQNRVQSLQSRLERARDYLLLQRQQLDAQTVSFASLAGGVAGDGSGLQITRWLRYSKLDKTPTPGNGGTTTEAVPATGAATKYTSAAVMTTLQPAESATRAIAAASFSQQASQTPDVNLSATTQLFKRTGVISGAQLSNLEYSLQSAKFTALDRAWAGNRMTTAPSVEVEPHQFGVIGHIAPDENQYRNSYDALEQLRSATLNAVFSGDDVKLLQPQFEADNLTKPGELSEEKYKDTPYSEIDDSVQRHYKALFDIGEILTRHISIVENLQATLAAELIGEQKKLQDMQGALAKLASVITAARGELDALNGLRLNALGDYAMTQRLLEENWRTVESIYLERRRILTDLLGLYYVRVRHAPISTPLAAPRALRYGAADDIVPGCESDTDPVLPDALGEFLDAVLEIPLADWNALAPLVHLLPDTARLQQMFQLRQARLSVQPTAAAKSTAGAMSQRLSTLAVATRGALTELIARPWSAGVSLKQSQSTGGDVLSLQDVIAGPSGELRRRAVQRRDRLEQALSCLLEQLPAVPPSVRLQWAQAAEDDTLPVETPQRWPALELAQSQNFNSVRTAVELVAWWFRQMRDGAAAASRTAMRNAIRAVLIQAAYGEASDILHGSVQTVPGRFRLGELLRVHLNKMPPAGAKLQLLDNAQQLIGMVRVEDSDPQGATVSIVNVIKPAATLTTAFTVIAARSGR
ncbi:MAG: hypothetical protein P8Y53_03590 [Pseudolabrys sp.]